MKITGLILVRILTGLLLVCPLSLLGQYTQTTAIVLDPNGQPYSNCSFQINFVGQNTVPGHPPYTLGGAPGGQFQQQVSGSCTSAALLSARLADNNQINPLPSQWEFTICDQTRTYCFTSLCTVTGASLDVSACVNANAVALPGGGGGGGPITINALLAAIAPNTINNGNYRQIWQWTLTGTSPTTGLSFGELSPSTNTGSTSALLDVYTLAGSTIRPFKAVANVSSTNAAGTGLVIAPNGDITSLGGANFVTNIKGLTQCIEADPTGKLFGSGALCSSGGGGGGGSGGFGLVVPTVYPTIQQALTTAQAAGTGPVVVLPTSTDTTGYSNPNSIRIQNYKENAQGADSLFFRDVSEWGPIDGTVLSCNAVAGSNVVYCGFTAGGTYVNAPAPAGEIGKLIIIQGAGQGTYGQIAGTMSVASTTGLTGGTPNSYQPITFTDSTDGCTDISTMPYGHIHLDANGLPTGNVDFNNWGGKGCTHAPTQGTVATVGGTVQFTGGSIAAGDLVAKVTAVNPSTNQLTLDTPATYTIGGTNAYYGSDAHDTFQAACNSLSQGGFLTNGTLTFSGVALISHGIDCNSSGLRILGRSPHALASAIIYAGKTPNNMMNGNQRVTGGPTASPLVPNAYVLNLAQGGAAKVERIHILGNSQAMPYGIISSFGSGCYQQSNPPNGPYDIDCFQAPGTGNFISQMHTLDQVTIGNFWGDPINDGVMRLQSCVFFAGWTGNADFTSMDHIYCYNADVGMDSVNDQATGLNIGKWLAQGNNIGLSLSGGIHVNEYYTEFNRADLFMGSPYWPGGFPENATVDSYGGESSAMDFGGASRVAYNCYYLDMKDGELGGDVNKYGRPDGISMDFGSAGCVASVKWTGNALGNVLIPFDTEGNPGSNALEFNGGWGGFPITKFRFLNPSTYGCGNGSCWGWGMSNQFLKVDALNIDLSLFSNLSQWQSYLVSVPGSPYYAFSSTMPTLLEQEGKSRVTIGSLSVQSVNWGASGQAGYGSGPVVVCNGIQQGQPGYVACGSTTYNYRLTCTDSLGNESSPSPAYPSGGASTIMTTTTGPSSLSANPLNYILFGVHPRSGCDKYNLYGDNGVGGVIGFLTSATTDALGNAGFNDHGQWTKNTSVVAPVVGTMGSVNIASNLTVGGLTQLNNVNISGTCTGTGCGTGGGGSMVYPAAGIGNSTGTAWGTSYSATNQIPSNFIPTLNQSTTGNAATASSLDHSPPQCSAGNFAIGITANGSANCATPSGGIPQVVIASGTTPLIIKTPDLATSITFGMTNGANPSITSSTGLINFSNLVISNLAGTGTALLQADASGNVTRSSAGTITYPATTGIANTTTTGGPWATSYSSSNPIPANFIPILNQPTTGNAGTATALAATPTACTGSQFATGISASGNAICATPSVSGSTSISALTGATANNTLSVGTYQQAWNCSLTGTVAGDCFLFGETSPSTNSGTNSAIMGITTSTGSTIMPFRALAHGTGLQVAGSGDIQSVGSAAFVGPVRLPLISANALATDGSGNIIVGSSTGGADGGIPTSLGTTYTVAPTDFANCTNFYLSSGSSTVTLPATMPPAGQCVRFTNYSTGGLTVQRNSGTTFTINATAGPISLVSSISSLSPNSAMLTSDGTSNFVMQTGRGTASFSYVLSGTSSGAAMVVGNSSTLTTTGTGLISANQINGGTVPASATALATNSSGQIIVGTGGGMVWPTSTGIAVYNGSSAWTTGYSSSNPIPANVLGSGATGGGTNCLKDNQTYGSCGGATEWNMPVYVVQGSGTSLGGGFTAASAPSVAAITGATSTQPGVGGAAFSTTGTPAKGTQWMEWHKELVSTFTAVNSIAAVFYSDTATTGNAVWDVQLACGTVGSTIPPTYGSAIALGTQAVAAINTRYRVTVTSPTFSCAGGSIMWLRILLDSTGTTVSTGNLVLTDLAAYTQ